MIERRTFVQLLGGAAAATLVTEVEMVVNMKAARTLGITEPLAMLGRADKVIE